MGRGAAYSIFVALVVSPLLLIGCSDSGNKNGTGGTGGGTGGAGGTAKLDGGGTGGETGVPTIDGGAGKTDGGSGNTVDGRQDTSVDAPITSDTATALDSNALDGGIGTVAQQCLTGLVNPFAAMAPDWANWSSSSCSSLAAADGSLVLTQDEPCSAASPNAIAGLAPPNVLCGDFDVQVDFAVTGLVAGVPGGIFASMRAHDLTVTTNGMTIERYAAEYPIPSSQSYQNYKSYTTNQGDDATSLFVATTDVTGRLRLTRAGTTVKSYYWKTGTPSGQWVLVNTATLTSTPWTLVLYEGDNSAANKGPKAPYSVTFSNLLVTSPGAGTGGAGSGGVGSGGVGAGGGSGGPGTGGATAISGTGGNGGSSASGGNSGGSEGGGGSSTDAAGEAGVANCNVTGSLIVNGDFEMGNVDFSTGYIYVAPTSKIDSENKYTIATDPSMVNVWGDWPAAGDHTTGHGNMLIVNGSPTVGTIVWSETVSVQPGTTYAFSFWAETLNGASGSLSTLQASVNSTPVGNILTTPATSGRWMEYTATWSSGTSTSAILTIVDTNLQGSFNDFALDDVSFVCH